MFYYFKRSFFIIALFSKALIFSGAELQFPMVQASKKSAQSDQYIFGKDYLARVIADIKRVRPGGKIKIESFVFTLIELAEALKNVDENVNIEVILSKDMMQYSKMVKDLLSSSKNIKIFYKHNTHEKIIIIEPTPEFDPTNIPVAYIGSHNPTNQAVSGGQIEMSQRIIETKVIRDLKEIFTARKEERQPNLSPDCSVKKRKRDDESSEEKSVALLNLPKRGTSKIYPSEKMLANEVFAGALEELSQSQSPRKKIDLGKKREVVAAWLTANEQILEKLEITAKQHPNTKFILMLDPRVCINKEIKIKLQALQAELHNLEVQIFQTPTRQGIPQLFHLKSMIIKGRNSFVINGTFHPNTTKKSARHTTIVTSVLPQTAEDLTKQLQTIPTLSLTHFLLKEEKKAKQQREAQVEQKQLEDQKRLEEESKRATNPYLSPYLGTPLLLTRSSSFYNTYNPYGQTQAELEALTEKYKQQELLRLEKEWSKSATNPYEQEAQEQREREQRRENARKKKALHLAQVEEKKQRKLEELEEESKRANNPYLNNSSFLPLPPPPPSSSYKLTYNPYKQEAQAELEKQREAEEYQKQQLELQKLEEKRQRLLKRDELQARYLKEKQNTLKTFFPERKLLSGQTPSGNPCLTHSPYQHVNPTGTGTYLLDFKS